MRWRLGQWCAVALVGFLLSCSSGDTSNNLTGTWTGSLQDSRAGRGQIELRLSHISTQLMGTWQHSFPDSRNNIGGMLTGTASSRLTGAPRELVITMIWSPTQAGACTFTVEAVLDNNDLDHFTGTYLPGDCPEPASGSFDVMRP